MYRNPNGTKRIEYQPADELFRQSTLDTLAGQTVTIMHPRSGFVDGKSWRDVAIGHVGDNIRQDGGCAVADLYIKDAAAVKAVKNRDVKYVSWGYKVDFDATPGETADGKRYDGVQRNIRGNHVAILPVGIAPRGGEECVLRLDSNGDEEYPELKSGVELETALAKITALETELKSVRTDAAELPKVRDALTAANARIAELGELLKPERLDSLAEARATVVALAKAEGIETAGKSATDLKRAVVAKRTPDLANRVDSMNDASLDAVMVVYGSQPHPSMTKVLETAAPTPAPAGTRTDAAEGVKTGTPKYADLYEKHLNESRNAWKNSGDRKVN